jgi:hypothetical protein
LAVIGTLLAIWHATGITRCDLVRIVNTPKV